MRYDDFLDTITPVLAAAALIAVLMWMVTTVE